MARAAGQGDKVKVHYTGMLSDGTVFDSSHGRDPLEFTIGQRQIIPGVEEGVVGMEQGESKTIEVPSDEGYGPHRPERVIEVGHDQLPSDLDLEIGMRLQGTQQGGQVVEFTVTDVGESSVTLDANHPLAGKDLTFEVELVEIS